MIGAAGTVKIHPTARDAMHPGSLWGRNGYSALAELHITGRDGAEPEISVRGYSPRAVRSGYEGGGTVGLTMTPAEALAFASALIEAADELKAARR